MKKRVFGRKLSRERDTRRALFRGLVSQFIEHGKIKTTRAKAKAIQPMIDRLVTLAKSGMVSTNRRVYAILGNNNKASKKLVEIVAPAFSKRTSGFTRAINVGRRKGDMAEMVSLEWVEEIKEVVKPEIKKKEGKVKKSTNKTKSVKTKKEPKTKKTKK